MIIYCCKQLTDINDTKHPMKDSYYYNSGNIPGSPDVLSLPSRRKYVEGGWYNGDVG